MPSSMASDRAASVYSQRTGFDRRNRRHEARGVPSAPRFADWTGSRNRRAVVERLCQGRRWVPSLL